MPSPKSGGGYFHDDPVFFQKTLSNFAKYLDSHPDVRVWIILDPPWEEPEGKGQEGLYNPWKHITRFNIKKNLWFRYPVDLRWKNGNDAVRRTLGKRVTYIETEPFICRKGKCNLKYYANDDHLHTAFTEKHATWIDPIFSYIASTSSP